MIKEDLRIEHKLFSNKFYIQCKVNYNIITGHLWWKKYIPQTGYAYVNIFGGLDCQFLPGHPENNLYSRSSKIIPPPNSFTTLEDAREYCKKILNPIKVQYYDPIV